MVIKHTIILHCKTLQNYPKLGFSVWKYATWDRCYGLKNIFAEKFSKKWRFCTKLSEFSSEHEWTSVLPDGIFSNQKSQLGYILEGLRRRWHMYMYDMAVLSILFGTFYDHLVPIFLVILVYFSIFPFWCVVPRKIGQPWWPYMPLFWLTEFLLKVIST
jgi:hypothetical protein